MTITVRAANSRDVHHIIPLLRELAEFEDMMHRFDPDIHSLRAQLNYNANPALNIWLAFEDDTPVGLCICYQRYSSFKSGWYTFLEDICVTQSHRGRGVARQLLKSAAARALDRSIPELELAVLDWNVNAIEAYEALGATKTGSETHEDGSQWFAMTFSEDALKALATD